MKRIFILSLFFLVTTTLWAAEPDFHWNADALTLSFPTPSEDSSGSVPLGNGENAANVVMVHIRKIREKIERSPQEPEYLKTVWGMGYKIEY